MNVKDNFDLYVGGISGVFKGVKIRDQQYTIQNIQNLVAIADNDEVTSISWGNDEETEILISCGRNGIRSVKVYDTDCSTFTCSFFCNIGKGKICGISRYDEAILTAVQSGEIKLWRFREEDGFVIKAGENLKKMRHSKINKNIIATGGRENYLKLFDINSQTRIFIEKNLPHDMLELRVPIWITDIDFLHNAEQIVTVSKYGHVRLYDSNAHRRPVINLEIKDQALTCLSVVPGKEQIIVGSGKGIMNLVDLRNPGKVLNIYKGFEGGVTGIACSKREPYVFSVSLDRYLRIHDIHTKTLLKKVYVTSKLSCLLLRSEFLLPKDDESNRETVKRGTKIGKYVAVKEQENNQIISDSDTEYDNLFEAMQVIGNKGENKLIEKSGK